MEILLITKNTANKGGLGRYSSQVFRGLKDQGQKVLVLTEEDGLFPLSYLKITDFLKNILHTRKIARNFDIVHALDGWPYGVYGYFAVVGTSKKLFINGVGTYSVAPFESFLKGFLLRRAYKRARGVFCISDYVRERILENVRLKNIKTVFMGANKLPELSEKQKEKYKGKYNLEKNFPIFLTVGAIKERKGQLDTLKSVALLKDRYPNFKYIMMGDDGDKNYIKQIKDFAKKNKLGDNYKIISGVYDDEASSFLYQICDVFLLNSNNDGGHFEGFGLVFLEASQFGKPVIGSSGCGIESALKDGYNGYLTKQKDHKDIKKKILKALENRDELGKNSKEFCKNFSWEKTVSEYIKHYEL